MEKVVDYALSFVTNHMDAHGLKQQKIKMNCCWSFPPNEIMLYLMTSLGQGVGAILRDHAGEVIFAASKKEYEVNYPTKIELLAMFRGLQLYAQQGILQELILESDSLITVETLKDEGELMSLLGTL